MPDGVQQVGLAQTGGAVDEQRVVAAARGLGHAEGGGEGELVRGALHERLERVAGVHAVGHAAAGADEDPLLDDPLLDDPPDDPPPEAAGLDVPVVREPLRLGLDVGDLHLDDEVDVAGTDLLEGIPHQRQVTRQNAVAGVRVRRTHPHHRCVTVQGHHVLEGGEPHGLGHLRAEELRDGCPQLFVVAHLRLLPDDRSKSTCLSTSCGQP